MTNLPANKRKNPPPPPSKIKTQSSGISSTLIDGITFGAGSAIGHSMINKISGLFSSEDKCSKILNSFNDCKKNYGNNKELLNNDACMDIFSDYEKCKK
jgi:hypothetical protein